MTRLPGYDDFLAYEVELHMAPCGEKTEDGRHDELEREKERASDYDLMRYCP